MPIERLCLGCSLCEFLSDFIHAIIMLLFIASFQALPGNWQ